MPREECLDCWAVNTGKEMSALLRSCQLLQLKLVVYNKMRGESPAMVCSLGTYVSKINVSVGRARIIYVVSRSNRSTDWDTEKIYWVLIWTEELDLCRTKWRKEFELRFVELGMKVLLLLLLFNAQHFAGYETE